MYASCIDEIIAKINEELAPLGELVLDKEGNWWSITHKYPSGHVVELLFLFHYSEPSKCEIINELESFLQGIIDAKETVK